MESITHAPGRNASTETIRRTARSSSVQVSDQIRGFYYDARRAALGHDYLRRKWLPREGPLFYAFIQVMRSFCYYNPNTGEFLSKNAEALKRFIKVQPRWLYDPKVGHKTQRSSVYLVALDDPPVPEDDHLVEEKAGELAAILTMEQVRQQPQAESASNDEEECTDLQNASQYALAKCESVMSRKMPDKSLPVSITSNTYLDRTFGGRSPVDRSIRNQKDEEKALVGVERASATGEQQSITPARSSQPQTSPRSHKSIKHQHQAQALAKAHPQVGATIHQALLDLGGSNPDGGVKTILEALTDVAAPPERMHDLFALGLRRLEQQQELHTIPNPTGYLIGVMRNVAVEAVVKGWNVAQMRAEDEVKHAQALRSRGCAGPEAHSPAAEAATAEVSPAAPDAVAEVAPDATTATTRAAGDGKPPASEATRAPEPPDEATSEAQTDQQEAAWEAERRAAEEEARHYAALPPDPRARQVWQSVLDRIQPKVSQSAYTTWFSGTWGHAREGDVFVVRVGSSFGQQHLETRFYALIKQMVSDQIGTKTEVRFVVISDQETEEGQ